MADPESHTDGESLNLDERLLEPSTEPERNLRHEVEQSKRQWHNDYNDAHFRVSEQYHNSNEPYESTIDTNDESRNHTQSPENHIGNGANPLLIEASEYNCAPTIDPGSELHSDENPTSQLEFAEESLPADSY